MKLIIYRIHNLCLFGTGVACLILNTRMALLGIEEFKLIDKAALMLLVACIAWFPLRGLYLVIREHALGTGDSDSREGEG